MQAIPNLTSATSQDVFPVLSSILLPQELLAALSPDYKIGGLRTCALIRSGLNDSYLVQSADQDYVLRVYRARWRSLPDIMWELEFLVHLANRGIGVAAPVPRIDSGLVSAVRAPEGLRYAALFTYAAGEPLRWDRQDAFCNTGRLTARLHHAADDFTCAHQRFCLDLEHLLDRPLQAILPRIGHRPQDTAYLLELTQRLRTGLAALAGRGLDWGPCHGDLMSGNIHCRDSDVLTLFDFDCCGLGWRAYELATVLLFVSFMRQEAGPRWRSFLDGYGEVRQLGRHDLEAIPLFTAARLVWSMGVQAAGADKWGLDRLDGGFWDARFSFLRQWETAPMPV